MVERKERTDISFSVRTEKRLKKSYNDGNERIDRLFNVRKECKRE